MILKVKLLQAQAIPLPIVFTVQNLTKVCKKWFIRLSFLLLLGLVMPLIAHEDTFEQTVASYQQHFLLNANILVAKHQRKRFEKNIGYANIAQKFPFTENTVFPIASISKQFTATAILLLHEEGKLELHQPIVHYLSKLHPLWQGQVPSWANTITIHHLLTHSSGLVNYTGDDFTFEKKSGSPIDDIFAVINHSALKFQPGTRFEYNNTGFLLLGMIIEAVTKQSLSDFLQQRIFAKAGMTHTFMPTLKEEIRLIQQGLIDDKLVYYCADLSDLNAQLTVVKKPFQVPLQGGAAIFSTQRDLLAWTKALYEQKAILSGPSLALMLTPHIKANEPWFGHYGYGIFIDNQNGMLLYRHGGWIEGVRTMLSYNPINQTTVIMLSNLSPCETQNEAVQRNQADAFNQLTVQLQQLV